MYKVTVSNLVILYYVLVSYGLTTIIVQSKIFKPIRDFFKNKSKFTHKLLNCMLCTGFWVGLLISFVFNSKIQMILDYPTIDWYFMFIYNIFYASFTSGLIWLIYLVQLNLEKNVGDKI
jgi:hypothetical protein